MINKTMEEAASRIMEILKEHNLRLTDTRWRILQVFLDHDHSHTITEIKNHLKKLGFKMNQATIYNNIFALGTANIITGYYNKTKQDIAYELSILENNIHLHIFNVDLNKYIYVEADDEIRELIERKCKEHGYDLHSATISINLKNWPEHKVLPMNNNQDKHNHHHD